MPTSESSHQVRAIARALVEVYAPDELDILDDVTNVVLMDARHPLRKRPDALGMGIGGYFALAELASLPLAAIAQWVAKEIPGKVLADLSVAALKKRLQDRFGLAASAKPAYGTLEVKLAASLLEHLQRKGKAFGIPEAQLAQIGNNVAANIIPILASAISKSHGTEK